MKTEKKCVGVLLIYTFSEAKTQASKVNKEKRVFFAFIYGNLCSVAHSYLL